MSTKAYPMMRTAADNFEEAYASAVCSGICGDAAHKKRGGPHISRDDQPRTNWSVIRPQDRVGQGPEDAACAIDMSMKPSDMRLATRRLKAVWANPNDPRRKYFNAFNGWTGGPEALRFDFITGKISKASRDHITHVHAELRRLYVGSKIALAAFRSAVRGESIATFLKTIGVVPKPAGAARPVVPGFPGHDLRRNDKQKKPDGNVKLWQQAILARGWKSIGKADGMFGPATQRNVVRMQKACRVRADGTINAATWPLPWTHPRG